MRKLVFLFAIAVIGLSSAPAADIYNNLTETVDQGVPMNANGAGNWRFNAEAFNTDSLNFNIQSVTLKLALGAFGTTTGTFDVSIWSNDTTGSPANRPGSLVANVATGQSASQIAPTGGFLTFTPASLIQLNPNQTYWVVLDASNYTGGRQIFSGGTTSSAGSGVTSNMMLQKDVNNTWSQNFPASGTSHMVMSVTVPEPSTYALGLIATGLVGALSRRRMTV